MPWKPVVGHFVVAKLDGKVRQVLALAWNSGTGAVRVDWPLQTPANSSHRYSRMGSTVIDKSCFEPLDPEGFSAVTERQRLVGREPTVVSAKDGPLSDGNALEIPKEEANAGEETVKQDAGADLDDRVLILRDSELTFPAIAKQLTLPGAAAAHTCFLRALARRSPDERTILRQRELRRLDALASQISKRSDLEANEVQARLKLIDQLRDLMFTEELEN